MMTKKLDGYVESFVWRLNWLQKHITADYKAKFRLLAIADKIRKSKEILAANEKDLKAGVNLEMLF